LHQVGTSGHIEASIGRSRSHLDNSFKRGGTSLNCYIATVGCCFLTQNKLKIEAVGFYETGPNYGPDQSGSCPRRQPARDAMTSLE